MLTVKLFKLSVLTKNTIFSFQNKKPKQLHSNLKLESLKNISLREIKFKITFLTIFLLLLYGVLLNPLYKSKIQPFKTVQTISNQLKSKLCFTRVV